MAQAAVQTLADHRGDLLEWHDTPAKVFTPQFCNLSIHDKSILLNLNVLFVIMGSKQRIGPLVVRDNDYSFGFRKRQLIAWYAPLALPSKIDYWFAGQIKANVTPTQLLWQEREIAIRLIYNIFHRSHKSRISRTLVQTESTARIELD